MKYVNLLIAALAIQFAVHFATANQGNLSPQSKIIGGSAIQIRDVPFLLSFHMRGKYYCGGVIISKSWGLTALHCVFPYTTERDYFVRAGSTLTTRGGSTHGIKKFYSYNSMTPDDPKMHKYDILLFSVKKNFRFNGNVRPAKLPVEGIDSPNSLQVTGWGSTNGSVQIYPKVILTVSVEKVTTEECVAAGPVYEEIVTEELHLCYGGKDADACQGDSGGPLADSQTVYGIVSSGVDCGVYPGIYSKVSFFRQWIKKITGI